MKLGIQICSELEWESAKSILKIKRNDLQHYPFGEYFVRSLGQHECICFHSGATKTKAAAACQFAIDMDISRSGIGQMQVIEFISHLYFFSGFAISHFKKMGVKSLFLPIGKFLGEKEKGGIPRIQNSGDTILNSTRFAE